MADAVFAVPMARFPFQSGGVTVHDEEVIKTGHSGQGGRKFLPIRAGGRDIPHHQNTWRQRDSL